jgi:GT2 family glycosyltransferase/glycosyltransferase involved in cell wall biosynthesis
MSKKVIFILGMHRSGTSALAGALQASGVSGGRAFIRPSFDNVKGFFENEEALRINEAVLDDLGLTWDSPFDLPAHWVHDSKMLPRRQAIQHFLNAELAGHSTLYVKDPRLSYLLPLWQLALAELEIEAQYIICVRQPIEVWQSLRKRNQLGKNEALTLWLNHTLLAEKNTRNTRRLFVQYDDLLANPLAKIETILQAFQVKPGDWERKKTVVQAFIDKKLRHHEAKPSGESLALLPCYAPILGCLKTLAGAPDDPAAMAEMDDIRALFLSNLGFFTPETKEEFFATLVAEAGEHSRMVAPVRMPVFPGVEKVVFSLNDVAFSIGEIRIFPSNELCHLTFNRLEINYIDGSSTQFENCEKHILLEHGVDFIIGGESFLTLTPDAGKRPESVVLYGRYNSLGNAALSDLAKMGDSINAWFYNRLDEKDQASNAQTAEWNRKKEEWDRTAAAWKEDLRLRLEDWKRQTDDWKRQNEDWERRKYEWNQVVQLKNEQLAAAAERSAADAASFARQRLALEHEIRQAANLHETFVAKANAEATAQENRIAELDNNIGTLNRQVESSRQEIAGLKNTVKEKDDLIWELYARQQRTEMDYRQSLKTLDDVKASISYRAGMALTWPLRRLYDLTSNKPMNETRLWLFSQFIIAGVRMPGRMLSQINAKNINTLRKALKNESPREIAGNLIKLLTGQSALAISPAHIETIAAPMVAPPPTISNGPEALRMSENGATAWQTAANFNTKKVVVFASPFLPDFDMSSGGKRATRLLELLAQDCEVYAFTLGNKPEKHIRKLESVGVRVFQSNDFQGFKRLVPSVDTLIFSFFYTYFDCDKFLSLYPNARVIVDSVDVHWVRHERSRGLWPDLTDEVIRMKKALEIEVYKKAGIVWTVTEQDRQAVLAEAPAVDVRIVSNVHTAEVTTYQDPGNHNLLFMGGFAHYPNIIAVKELALDIFPKIKAQVPEARLLIAGSQAPSDVQDLGKLPGVEFLGFIEENSIGDLYRNSFLALAPLQAGAGIKGKICEAISYGVPVVTNSIGNEGIELENEKSGLVSDDKSELIRLTVSALRREYDLAAMTRHAQSRLYDLVGPETVKRNMLGSISEEEVSICIVTWNKQKLLQRCIESIENHTHGIRYKIIVWSNGCTDGTQQYLEAAAKINPNIIPVLSKTNDVFVIPNNRMMRMFPANDVVLLNNDTFVTEGWLTALRDAAYSSEEIGITGSKLLYPDGRLQEFGSELYDDGTGRNIGKYDDPGKDEYNEPKFVGYVSGCSFYIKRSTIEKIGVFDETFHPCYCEDSDYCYTAWENGLATLVTPDSVIYHDEGGTSGTDTSKGFKAYQKVNFEKFLAKHGGRLEELATRIKLKNLMLLRPTIEIVG